MFPAFVNRARAGGPVSARRLAIVAVTVLAVIPLAAVAASSTEPEVTVHGDVGLYRVAATFEVSQPAALVIAVLTDYEQIPRFMPAVHTSNVIERGEGRTVVEQEAVARFLMFSKRIHLVLEVQEGAEVLRFQDRCGQSFAHYEGKWTITETGGNATISYELRAQPRFDVPEFLLKRLFRRDAVQMIQRLRTEIADRAEKRAN